MQMLYKARAKWRLSLSNSSVSGNHGGLSCLGAATVSLRVSEGQNRGPRKATRAAASRKPARSSAAGPTSHQWKVVQEMFLVSRPRFIGLAYSILRNKTLSAVRHGARLSEGIAGNFPPTLVEAIVRNTRFFRKTRTQFRTVSTLIISLVLAAPAFAQANSPWENAVNVLQQAFTSTIARGLSLVAIVVSGLTFAFAQSRATSAIRSMWSSKSNENPAAGQRCFAATRFGECGSHSAEF